MGTFVSEEFASSMFKVEESIFPLKMFVSVSQYSISHDITYQSQ